MDYDLNSMSAASVVATVIACASKLGLIDTADEYAV